LAGARLPLSIGLGSLAFLLAGGWGAWLAGREAWGRSSGAILTAAAYLLSPHLLLDLYVRGNFNEFAAVALYPWAAWGLLRLARSGSTLRSTAPRAIAIALVGLSHVGAFVILVMWVAAMTIGLAWVRRDPGIPLRALAAAALGAGLAAYFLVPCASHLGSTKADLLRSD